MCEREGCNRKLKKLRKVEGLLMKVIPPVYMLAWSKLAGLGKLFFQCIRSVCLRRVILKAPHESVKNQTLSSDHLTQISQIHWYTRTFLQIPVGDMHVLGVTVDCGTATRRLCTSIPASLRPGPLMLNMP
jgi:hypothetical protein